MSPMQTATRTPSSESENRRDPGPMDGRHPFPLADPPRAGLSDSLLIDPRTGREGGGRGEHGKARCSPGDFCFDETGKVDTTRQGDEASPDVVLVYTTLGLLLFRYVRAWYLPYMYSYMARLFLFDGIRYTGACLRRLVDLTKRGIIATRLA
ncbi:hypothetical protein BDP55DRAFT_634578 [Colletotrichum godetiae]|uniref:Uncharacterized protein n=1 Tax=Colletotrichum godetiae TaxID=1209918 RepID=A0AAJ0EV17_9PEZI|nr:uncharacterized protein BDP55DRAFT_634578 [Colletotrichum godetiae]KAK1672820.1 hypothetical protein BDP55DRAFT_634578 [Colletotrichum godetiae]